MIMSRLYRWISGAPATAAPPLSADGLAPAEIERALALARSGDVAAGIDHLATLAKSSPTPHQAFARLEALAQRFASDAKLRPWLVLARAQQAWVYEAAGPLSGAFDINLRLVHEFSRDNDPLIADVVTSCMLRICRHLAAQGDTASARRALDEVADRCIHNEDPAAHLPIAQMFGELAGGVDIERPAEHVGTDPMIQSWLAECFELKQSGEMSEATFAATIESINDIGQRVQQEAADLHTRARAVVEAYRRDGDPFGLFLRNFDVETMKSQIRTDKGDAPLLGSYGNEGRVEKGAVEGMAAALRPEPKLPMIGIANPSLGTAQPNFTHAAAKLEMPDRLWRAALLELADTAAIVILQLTGASTGVVFELRAVVALGRQNDTLVIVSPPTGPSSQPMLADAQFHDDVSDVSPVVAEIRGLLATFPHVIAEGELSFEEIGRLPVVARAIERIRFARALPVTDRRRSMRAGQLGTMGAGRRDDDDRKSACAGRDET